MKQTPEGEMRKRSRDKGTNSQGPEKEAHKEKVAEYINTFNILCNLFEKIDVRCPPPFRNCPFLNGNLKDPIDSNFPAAIIKTDKLSFIT